MSERITRDDDIFEFVFYESMQDATNQRAYEGKEKTWLKKCTNHDCTDEIKTFLNHVINGKFKNQEDYDKSFLTLVVNVCEDVNNNSESDEVKFTFGNAQKLINMILKYFYIVSYKKKLDEDPFRFCHCPMDRRMLELVWKKRKSIEVINNNYKRDDFLKPWSKEDFKSVDGILCLPNRYMDFQKAIKIISEEKCTPIQYDYHCWLPS